MWRATRLGRTGLMTVGWRFTSGTTRGTAASGGKGGRGEEGGGEEGGGGEGEVGGVLRCRWGEGGG